MLLLGQTACGGDHRFERSTTADSHGFVGTIEDTDAFIAVIAGGGQAVVYLCDGEVDLAEWFTGAAGSDGAIDLRNDNGARVIADAVGDHIEGSVTLVNGEQHAFVASSAIGDAGLYRLDAVAANAVGVQAGWIVDNAGEQRGSLRVNGARRPAPPAPGKTLDVDGVNIPVVVYIIKPMPDVANKPSAPTPPPGVPIPYPNSDAPAIPT